MKQINANTEVPSVEEMNIKICSAHWMFNTIMNNCDSVVIFDMRSMYYYLRGHMDFNLRSDSNIPLPVDYLLENDLNIKDIHDWLPKLSETDPEMKKFNLLNDEKLKNFKNIKRKYVFIIATQQKNIDSFKIEKIFRPRYGEGVISLNKKDRL